MRARAALLAATLIGLVVAALAVADVGVGAVLAAVARIGPGGFAALCAYSAGPLALLGLAWWAVAPDAPPARYVWARTVREGATDVLPFSQFGGLVVGARVLGAAGVPAARTWAGMLADLSTELGSQLVFTLYGAGALALALGGRAEAGALWPVLGVGLAATAGVLGAFVGLQRPMLRLVGALGERVLPGAAAATAGVGDELARVYAQRARVAAAFALNLAAWVASAGGAWLALGWMGADAALWAVLAIEALVFALRSAAFMVPGAYGVQEAAYALLGPLFGIDPATALALSLIKRARDLAIGVPALLLWQWGEGRALAGRRAAR